MREERGERREERGDGSKLSSGTTREPPSTVSKIKFYIWKDV
jgi:hypothetical protein